MERKNYLKKLHQDTAKKIEKMTLTYLEENSCKERIFHLLWHRFDFPRLNEVVHWDTCTRIAHKIGITSPTAKDARDVGMGLRFIYQGNSKMFRQCGKEKLVRIPPPKLNYDWNTD